MNVHQRGWKRSFSSDSGGGANFAPDRFTVVFSGERLQEGYQKSHLLLVQFVVTELVMIHLRNGFLQRPCGGVMHVRPSEFHVAEGRNTEPVPVRFLFGEIHQTVIVIGFGASGKEIAFKVGVFKRLSSHGGTGVAGLAAKLQEKLVTLFGVLADGVFIPFQVTVKRAVRRDEGLFIFRDGIRDGSPVNP